jgi:hypothetical protein
LAKEKVQVPLTFELGWQRQEIKGQTTALNEVSSNQPALR